MSKVAPLRSRAGSVRVAAMAVVASVALVTVIAGPVDAADTKNELLQLSSDGVNFVTNAAPTMFSSTKGYVPGESRRGTVWVRNASKQSAYLSLAVRNAGSATTFVLPGHLRLQAQSPGHGPTAATLPSPGACAPVIEAWTLAAGAVLPLTLDLVMGLDSPNSTRNQALDFTLTVVLQEEGPGQRVDPCAGAPDSSSAADGVASMNIGGGAAGTATGGSVGAGVSDNAQGSNGADAGNDAVPEVMPLFHKLQSNVEATTYDPWTWIVLVSGCLYMFVLSRKRSTTR
ncbi:hypothetical protein [Arthrobacter sp. BF1]|uniref:hypothetical protein n=1 Tax=Arthrobacter sp. BF1 TaxID=2821145 RepID=UPI001C4EB274|nr:hypothetical protein [Arthrobacter sp. BF1]